MESNNIDINSDIGTQIRKKREEKGWSQTELANKVFLTQQSISKIERGEMLPSLDKIADFIRILGISVYIPPEKLEEKVITHEITNTKNCRGKKPDLSQTISKIRQFFVFYKKKYKDYKKIRFFVWLVR